MFQDDERGGAIADEPADASLAGDGEVSGIIFDSEAPGDSDLSAPESRDPVGYDTGASAPAEMASLLKYFDVCYETFLTFETLYFQGLRRRLTAAGICSTDEVLNQKTYQAAVKAFQSQNGLEADGMPGPGTLWALQERWAPAQKQPLVKVAADKWPSCDGYTSFTMRKDLAQRYEAARAEVVAAGGVLTSAGAVRYPSDGATAGRSLASFHYPALAIDLAIYSGMQDVKKDAYLIEDDGGRYWQVWAKASGGEVRTLEAVTVSGGKITQTLVSERVIDLTAILAKHGLARISRRNGFPGTYTCAEWWHFQGNDLLVPLVSQLGIELLRVDNASYTEAALKSTSLWAERQRIFRVMASGKGWN